MVTGCGDRSIAISFGLVANIRMETTLPLDKVVRYSRLSCLIKTGESGTFGASDAGGNGEEQLKICNNDQVIKM